MEIHDASADIHGHRTIPGAAQHITIKRAKQLQRNAIALAPKRKNGITDPFTYYHVVDQLLTIKPGQLFTAREFTQALGERPLHFDPITVGRVLGDISESLNDSYGWSAVHSLRSTDGRRYWTSSDLEEWVTLERLLEDLERLCALPADRRSPLLRCPSLGIEA